MLRINIQSLSWSLGDIAVNRQTESVWRLYCCPLGCFLCLPCRCKCHYNWISHAALLSILLHVLASEMGSKVLQGCTRVWNPLAATRNGRDRPLLWAFPFERERTNGKLLKLIPGILKPSLKYTLELLSIHENWHDRIHIAIFFPPTTAAKKHIGTLPWFRIKCWQHASRFQLTIFPAAGCPNW